MFNEKKVILIKLALFFVLLVMWAIFTYILGDEAYYFYALALVFLPMFALYFYRLKQNKSIEKLNKVFKFFAWIFIIITARILIGEFIWGYPYSLDWWSIGEFCYFILPLIVYIIVLFLMVKADILLVPKEDRKKWQKETVIAITAIVLTLALASLIWFGAELEVNKSIGWGLDDSFINDMRDLAFKKIIVFSGLIFTSAFLLLYSLKKQTKE